MLSLSCPNCGARLTLDDSARGHRVVCASCGEGFFVAAQSSHASPELPRKPSTPAVEIVERPTRPRRKGPAILNIAVHIAISCAAAYALYLIYTKSSSPPPAPRRVVIQRSEPRRPQAKPKPPVVVSPPAIVEETPREQPQLVEPPPAKPVFENVPAVVDLPPANDDQIAQLASVPANATLALLTNSDSVTLADGRITVDGRLAAGLRIHEGQLEFRWTNPAEEAETAVRNALVRLTLGNQTHAIALRSPVELEAPKLELKSVLRIVGKCEAPPPAGGVRFAFTLPVPTKATEGNPNAMQAGDEVVLRYDVASDVATRVQMTPGATLRAEFESQYILPSGDVEPLTIAKGNRKLRELEDVYAAAVNAEQSISRLRSYHSRLNSELRSAQSIRTVSAPGFENPVLVAQKSAAISRVQAEIVATERNIARAEQLIRDKPAIDRDLADLRRIAEFAQSLKNTPVQYRFYTVVDGHEINLIVAE